MKKRIIFAILILLISSANYSLGCTMQNINEYFIDNTNISHVIISFDYNNYAAYITDGNEVQSIINLINSQKFDDSNDKVEFDKRLTFTFYDFEDEILISIFLDAFGNVAMKKSKDDYPKLFRTDSNLYNSICDIYDKYRKQQ